MHEEKRAADGTVFVTGPGPNGHVHYASLGDAFTDEADGHRHKIERGAGRTYAEANHDHALPEHFTQANKSARGLPFELHGEITKIDEEQQLAYGWFSVIEENGVPVVDSQGDIIPEADLVKAIHGFVSDARSGKMMHKGEPVAELVEAVVFTHDVQKALSIDLKRVGAFGAFKVHDAEAWAGIKSGKYRAFSIGGRGVRAEA